MRDASPLSLRGTGESHETSCFRSTTRAALIPQVGRSPGGKRSCENGMRSSTVQPPASMATAEAHTASHDSSSTMSFETAVSRWTPAAVTVNATPVRRSKFGSR